MEKAEPLSRAVCGNGGNPYHDERGRFTYAPGGKNISPDLFSQASSFETKKQKKLRLQSLNDVAYPYKGLYLADGNRIASVIDGSYVDMPEGVSLMENAKIGESLRTLSVYDKYVSLFDMFCRGGSMDCQSILSVTREYNYRYISFGNFNYGVVMAAAGFSLGDAKFFAAVINSAGGGKKKYYVIGGNSDNEAMIERGYQEYLSHNLPNDSR